MTQGEEQMLAQWQGLTLTQYRLFHEGDDGGGDFLSSMSLDCVEFVTVRRQHHPVLIVLAVCVFIAGAPLSLFIPHLAVALAVFLTVGVGAGALLIAYFFSRSVKFIIKSSGSEIAIEVKGSTAERQVAIMFAKQVQLRALNCRGRL